MSDTITYKIAELPRIIYAVAYLSLPDLRVTVWANGSRMAELSIAPFSADQNVKDIAADTLRFAGWTVYSDWTRPSDEWTEFRAEVLGTENIVGEAPLSWITVES